MTLEFFFLILVTFHSVRISANSVTSVNFPPPVKKNPTLSLPLVNWKFTQQILNLLVIFHLLQGILNSKLERVSSQTLRSLLCWVKMEQEKQPSSGYWPGNLCQMKEVRLRMLYYTWYMLLIACIWFFKFLYLVSGKINWFDLSNNSTIIVRLRLYYVFTCTSKLLSITHVLVKIRTDIYFSWSTWHR